MGSEAEGERREWDQKQKVKEGSGINFWCCCILQCRRARRPQPWFKSRAGGGYLLFKCWHVIRQLLPARARAATPPLAPAPAPGPSGTLGVPGCGQGHGFVPGCEPVRIEKQSRGPVHIHWPVPSGPTHCRACLRSTWLISPMGGKAYMQGGEDTEMKRIHQPG